MLALAQAQDLVLEHAKTLGSQQKNLLDLIETSGGLPFVLAETLLARRNLPPWACSAMDGFGVVFGGPKKLSVIEDIPAGTTGSRVIESHQAVRIMTGAPIPAGVDTVIPVEQTRAEDRNTVEILEAGRKGQHIRQAGEDLRAGEVALTRGSYLTPAALGVLASQGISEVPVFRKPRVALLSTGDELVSFDQEPRSAQIVDSNSVTVRAALGELGCQVDFLGICRDDKNLLRETLQKAFSSSDLVLTCGGVSVGERDHVQDCVKELGGEILFWNVAIKPGKPALFARRGNSYLLGLPGNPVSVAVVFELLARPALLKSMGYVHLWRPTIQAIAQARFKASKNRRSFMRVLLQQKEGQWHCAPAGHQGSHVLSAMAQAQGLLMIDGDQADFEPGDLAKVMLLTPLAGLHG